MDFKTIIEKNDTNEIINSKYINWDFFKNKSILVTGATGLIGCQIVLALLLANEKYNTNITIYALVRNKEKAINKFKNNITDKFNFITQDITDKIVCPKVDLIIHTANGTASIDFVEKAVETIDSIYSGTKNILEYARINNISSIVYLSSMEVYGEISLNNKTPLKENQYGYMDIKNIRNSYPMGKKIAETLCLSYYDEYQIPVKIARLSQTIGANVNYDDNRVFAQFARSVVEYKDIVLNSKGETIRSYCYITDAICAILALLEKGRNGESYNVANIKATCSIKDMAETLTTKYVNTNLIFDVKNTTQYLGTVNYTLDTEKIKNDTNWEAHIMLDEMYSRLIMNFKHQKGE